LDRNVRTNAKTNATHAVLATSDRSIVSIDLSIVDALLRSCLLMRKGLVGPVVPLYQHEASLMKLD